MLGRNHHVKNVRRISWRIGLTTLAVLTLTESVGSQVPVESENAQTVLAVPRILETQELPVYLDQVVDPAQYTVGPGDRFVIHVWGERPQKFAVTITPEATVIIPTIGVIDVNGLKLSALKSKISNRMRELFPRAQTSVTLTEVRRFRVTVSGAVRKPGLLVVTAAERASEVIARAEPTAQARQRGIRILRNDTSLSVDLTTFGRLGRFTDNPYLTEGDVIQVSTRDDRWESISVLGAVNDPIRVDFVDGDALGDLIDLAFGLAANADTTRLELWRFPASGDSARPVAWPQGTSYSDWRAYPLEADDRLVVRSLNNYHPQHSVEITGEVMRPGWYIFNTDSLPLDALIDSAGGVTPWADLKHATITRTRIPLWSEEMKTRFDLVPTNLRSRTEDDFLLAEALSISGRVVTDFTRLVVDGDQSFNVSLVSGDHVRIPRRTDGVNVIGRVVQPGLVTFRADAGPNYYLQRAGGYSWQADRAKTFLIKGATGAAIKLNNVDGIEPGDSIIIPTKRPKSLWSSVRETLVIFSSLATVYLVINQATK